MVRAGRNHSEFVAYGPEAQQPDAELTLQAARTACLQPALDGIADMGGNVVEIRTALLVPRNALTVIAYRQEVTAVFAPSRDGNLAGLCVDAVLDQLGNRLERITLRQCDDRDRIPVISNLELAARPRLDRTCCHRLPLAPIPKVDRILPRVE